MSGDQRWQGRPWAARAVKLVAVAGPLVVAVLATIWLGRRLPPPGSVWVALGQWLLLGLVATVIVLALDRLARRLLPFAALLKLSLAFPGRVPSRYKVARGRGGSRELQAEVERAREHGLSDDRTEAAVTVLRLVAALSTHDSATRGHAERVRVFVDMIADELDLSPHEVDRLRWAALLHDVGKIAVHPDVLNDPGRPSDEDWEVLRTHPLEGARITAPLRPWLGHWALAIEQHHERWDGEGYPYGLAGKELSLGARVVSVADAYDVMTAARAYKQPMPAAEAREELARHAGTQFDPAVVRAFLAIPLDRLRWAVGPFSWFVATPFGRPFQSLSSGAGVVAAAAAATVVGATAAALPAATLDGPGVVDAPVVEQAEEPAAGPTDAPTSPAAPPSTPASPAPTPPSPEASPTAAPPGPAGTPPVAPPESVPPTDPAVLAVMGEDAAIDEDGVLTLDVLANDRAGGGGSLSLRDALAEVGTTEWSADGLVTWRPPADFVGATTLVYLVTDGTDSDVGTVAIEVVAVNDAPVLTDDIATVTEDTPQVIDLLGDDVDPDGDPLTLVAVDAGDAPLGTASDNGDGTVTYTPAPEASGVHTLRYTASDGTTSATATLDVVIVAVDDPPRAGADSAAVDEDGTVAVDVLANDVEVDGDPLEVTAVTLPGAATSVAGGTVTITPAADTNGLLSGTVTVSDGTSADTSDLTIEVRPVNDAPTITAGGDVEVATGAGPVTVGGWATGITPGPADESSQVLTATVAVDAPGQFASPPVLDPATGDLSFAFTPTAAAVATATITLSDDGGTARGGDDTTVVTVTITAVPGPVAVDDAGSIDEDRTLVMDLLWNDTDPTGGGLSIASVDQSATTLGSVTVLGGGNVQYRPHPDEYGVDTFAYTITNGVATDTATVTIQVLPLPDAPVAADDAYATTTGTPLTVTAPFGVLRNDGDEDGDALAVDTTFTDPPPVGEGAVLLAADGSFTFTPASGFTGVTSFGYRVTDGARTDTATATVTVLPALSTGELFLTGDPVDATTSRLSATAPAVADPPPDWDADGEPGLTIAESPQDLGEADPTRFHDWAHTPASDLVLDGPVELRLTSVDEADPRDRVDWTVGLYECVPGGACTLLASTADVHVEPWAPGGTWAEQVLPVGRVAETIEAGNTLRVRLLFGHQDVRIALTGDRRSSLLFTTPS